MQLKNLWYLAGMVSCTVLANLLLKTGAVMGSTYMGMLNWRTIAGLASFGTAALFYIVLLRTVALNVATSFASVQYVAVILASAYFLDERINLHQWIGIACISLGVAIVGFAQS